MVKRLATSPHAPLGITDSACKNQLVKVSVQYDSFISNISIGSITIGKSRVISHAYIIGDQIATSHVLRDSIGYPRTRTSGEFSTTKHQLIHASGLHPIPPHNDPNGVGPRPEIRFLRQPALEGLTSLARTETPQKSDRNKFDHGKRRRPVAALKVADGGVARGGEGAAKLGITDSACKNQSVMVSVQYGPFNTYIPIRSTTIGKSRVAKDPITMHTSWRSNSDITSVTSIRYPRMRASGESSTTKHRLLHASGPHPIPPPNDPK
ncbi:125 kDa kinesin-related protein [Dorcoceras hygrometricum]|uniref:125 kDa kinesin-related protein n=1 Tax=Dorcoceras hygrometricum TaxID=472368 RepID=A0A2Z7A378_9LAMI|nr:125 kDa kinesin-related protein [Dorcoceras hygrometricum]